LKDVSLKPLYETHFKRVTESGRLRVPNTAPLPGDKGRLIQDGHRGGVEVERIYLTMQDSYGNLVVSQWEKKGS